MFASARSRSAYFQFLVNILSLSLSCSFLYSLCSSCRSVPRVCLSVRFFRLVCNAHIAQIHSRATHTQLISSLAHWHIFTINVNHLPCNQTKHINMNHETMHNYLSIRCQIIISFFFPFLFIYGLQNAFCVVHYFLRFYWDRETFTHLIYN